MYFDGEAISGLLPCQFGEQYIFARIAGALLSQ
jgi:hypothetical protein